ncbi:Ig-like domain-containing protein [Streptomyces sp. NPDC052051]|uniref:Ig-like domain-containing protein n=1 Tax=Streptomyces sp. NPDC052051 TaxID=3154649 RepID=UPI003417B8CB
MRRPGGSERGATTLEYVGAVIVAVAIVLALIGTGVAGSIGERFRCSISSLWGGGSCSSGGTESSPPTSNADYEPPLCTISTISDKAGSEFKLGFFKWGSEYGFKEQAHQANYDVNGDGKVDGGDQLIYTTFTDSASIGAAGGFGGKIGKLGKGEVELGGGIKVNNGDTWVFKSKEEAAAFRDDLEKLKMYETRRTSPGAGEASMGDGILALFGKGPLVEEEKLRKRIEGKLKDRHISYGSVGVYGDVDGGLSINAGDERVVSAGVNGSASINGDVVWTKDDFNGTKSYTYSVKASGVLGAEASAGGFETGDHAMGDRTATITVTRDQKTGELVRIDFTQTTETATGVSSGYKGGNGKDGKDAKNGGAGDTDNSGGSDIKVYTNTLTFPKGQDGAADRAVAQQWLDGNGDGSAVFSYLLSNNAPTQRPGADDPFGQLLFDQGKSSKTSYDGDSDAHEYGFELNLGLSVGASISLEKKSETLKNAEFLGAPRNGKRDYTPYSYCAK